MRFQPVIQVHFGRTVQVNPTTEAVRRTEDMCLSCGRLKPGQPDNCPDARTLCAMSINDHVATMVTRCPSWIAIGQA